MRCLILVCLLAAAICLSKAEYTKFQWQGIDLKDISIYEMDVTPMPVIHPGKAVLTFSGESKRQLKGILKVDLNIVRRISGVALPVRCYLAQGVYVGSCSYSDFCKVIQSVLPKFQPETCPQQLISYGIDCRCPFNIETTKLNIEDLEIELPDAYASMVSFLASGDFEISFKTADDIGSFGTIKIALSVKPKK